VKKNKSKGRFEETKRKLKEFFGIGLDADKPDFEGKPRRNGRKPLAVYGNVKIDIKRSSLGE